MLNIYEVHEFHFIREVRTDVAMKAAIFSEMSLCWQSYQITRGHVPADITRHMNHDGFLAYRIHRGPKLPLHG